MTTPSLPVPGDFPSSLEPNIYLAPNNKPTNIVIFLPGLGDTAGNFASFPRAVNLPDVLAITLNPPMPLPFPLGPGQHWSDDLQVDSGSGAFDPDSPLTKAAELVAQDVIKNVLIDKFKFRADHIHLFGLGQGGSTGLSAGLHPTLSSVSLGGIVSIGGAIPLSSPTPKTSQRTSKTPVLLLSGSRSPLASVDSSPLKRVKSAYEYVTYHQWKKGDDSMPKNRDEVMPMMQFWARTLKSRRGVPDDAIELT
jgi:predicted esterase